MAKCVLQLFVFICAVYAVVANMRTIPPDPNFPEQCYDGKKAYKIGKYFPTFRSCKQMLCREDFVLVYEDCGTVETPSGYKNVQDLTKRFPDCCVKLVKIDGDDKITNSTNNTIIPNSTNSTISSINTNSTIEEKSKS